MCDMPTVDAVLLGAAQSVPEKVGVIGLTVAVFALLVRIQFKRQEGLSSGKPPEGLHLSKCLDTGQAFLEDERIIRTFVRNPEPTQGPRPTAVPFQECSETGSRSVSGCPEPPSGSGTPAREPAGTMRFDGRLSWQRAHHYRMHRDGPHNRFVRNNDVVRRCQAVAYVSCLIAVVVLLTSCGANITTRRPSSISYDFFGSSETVSIPESEAQAVGTPSAVVRPTVLRGQPPLTENGKPEVLVICSEFSPTCAVERWAIILAFSQFGTISGYQETTSSPWDMPPAVATFTFSTATYRSSLLELTMVEHEGNDTHGPDTHRVLKPLTTQQSNLWGRYSSQLGVSDGYPFIDFGNKVFVLGPSYSPQVLKGLDVAGIASQLRNPESMVTESIVGTSNYLTAAICSLTNQLPGSVCSTPSTARAAKAMGLTR